jgi:hypothetical protein
MSGVMYLVVNDNAGPSVVIAMSERLKLFSSWKAAVAHAEKIGFGAMWVGLGVPKAGEMKAYMSRDIDVKIIALEVQCPE